MVSVLTNPPPVFATVTATLPTKPAIATSPPTLVSVPLEKVPWKRTALAELVITTEPPVKLKQPEQAPAVKVPVVTVTSPEVGVDTFPLRTLRSEDVVEYQFPRVALPETDAVPPEMLPCEI